jgi:hypothetical protein
MCKIMVSIVRWKKVELLEIEYPKLGTVNSKSYHVILRAHILVQDQTCWVEEPPLLEQVGTLNSRSRNLGRFGIYKRKYTVSNVAGSPETNGCGTALKCKMANARWASLMLRKAVNGGRAANNAELAPWASLQTHWIASLLSVTGARG